MKKVDDRFASPNLYWQLRTGQMLQKYKIGILKLIDKVYIFHNITFKYNELSGIFTYISLIVPTMHI